MGIRILLLELGLVMALAPVFPWQALEQRSVLCGVRPLSIPRNRQHACQSAERSLVAELIDLRRDD
jgi:hypothetical protein